VLDAVKNARGPVYAMVSPATAGQFGDVTVAQLRTAFKRIGFTGLVEVALFADILTLKEALIFDKNIKRDSDFMLTSCCCPIWIAWCAGGTAGFWTSCPTQCRLWWPADARSNACIRQL
jgi:iron only hydrogenase large subunit-like protein